MTKKELKTIIKVLKEQNELLSSELQNIQKWNSKLVLDKMALLKTIKILCNNES